MDRGRWNDEISRQRLRLEADLVSRQIGIAVTSLFYTIVLPFWFVFFSYLICIGTGIAAVRQMAAYEAAPNPARRIFFLFLSFVGLAAYSLPAVVIWQYDKPLVGFAATLALIGALLNVSVVRSIYLPFGLSAGLPPTLALLWLPLQQLLSDGPDFMTLAVTAAVIVFIGYFLSALVQNHRAQARLVDAIDRASAASADKSRFLAAMSHEVRTPLNAILGHSQLMGEESDPAAARKHAKVVESSARALKMLLEDVIDLAQAAEGEIRFNPVTAVIRRELELAAALKLPSRGGPEPEISIAVADEVPEFGRFDPILLRKCVSHLAAIVLGEQPGGRRPGINLRCALSPGKRDRLRLTISGNAPGDHAPVQPAGTEVPANGTLALTLVQRIAALMGARSDVMRAPDGGLVARIELPFTSIPEPPATGAEAIYGRLRVLVVDDIATNRFVVVQLLRSLRIEAIEANSGSDALEWLKAEAFDLVLLDMNMPDMDGEATFREIRSSGTDWASIPVIALTADAVTYQRDHYIGLGLNGYVTKPVDKHLLWAEILTAVPPPPPL